MSKRAERGKTARSCLTKTGDGGVRYKGVQRRREGGRGGEEKREEKRKQDSSRREGGNLRRTGKSLNTVRNARTSWQGRDKGQQEPQMAQLSLQVLFCDGVLRVVFSLAALSRCV